MTEIDPRAELVSLLPRLRRFALGLTGTPDMADELVQAGCLKAIERWHQWQPGTSLVSWLFRILQTTWFDQRRMQERRQTYTDTESLAQIEGEDGRRTHEARDMFERVRRMIAALPDDQRLVLLLVSVEGLSYKEAADTLNIPVGTVMSRLARARARLADALDYERGSLP